MVALRMKKRSVAGFRLVDKGEAVTGVRLEVGSTVEELVVVVVDIFALEKQVMLMEVTFNLYIMK